VRQQDAERELHQSEEPAGVAVEEAVAAHALQSLGQDVHGDAPQEVCDGQCAVGHALGLCLPIAEGDGLALFVVAKEVALGEDAPVEVAGEVFQDREATPHVLAVHDPFRWQCRRQVYAGTDQGVEHFGTEDLGEGEGVEEILALEGAPQTHPSCALVDAAPGDHDMQMGVIVEAPGVGVEDGAEADVGMEPGMVEPERLEGRGHG